MNYYEKAVSLRRELHKMPEIGWEEFKTTAKIIELLETLGWKVYVGTEQIGLEAVMGRPESVVQKGIQRALKDGVAEAMIARMQGS